MKGKQLYFDSFGQPEHVVKMKELETKKLSQGEILVEMEFFPINPSDLIPITGAYAHRTGLPSLIGYEGVGVVQRVYDKKDEGLLGKRVLPLRGEGTWQNFVITQSKYAVVVPSEIESTDASQCYINPVTAWVLCKEIFSLAQNDYLLVNASNSSIGQSLIQLSKIIGFNVLSVVRHERDKEQLLNLGAKAVINSSEENVFECVMRYTSGAGVHAAVDSIGGRMGTELAFCVKSGGYFRTIGLLSGEQINWSKIKEQCPISSEIFHLRHWLQRVSIDEWQEVFTSIFYHIVRKDWEIPRNSTIFPLDSYIEALKFASNPEKRGKIIFKCLVGVLLNQI